MRIIELGNLWQPLPDFLSELLIPTLTLTKYAPAVLIWFHFSVKYLYGVPAGRRRIEMLIWVNRIANAHSAIVQICQI